MAEQYTAASAHIADRLNALANRFTAPAGVPQTPRERFRTEWKTLPLYNIIDRRLRRLEEELTRGGAQESGG
jgi:hypothetical protein